VAGFSSDGVTLDCHSSSFLSSPLHGLPWSLENLVPVRVVGDVCLENLVRALVADGACLKILVPARVTGEGCLKSLVRVRIPGGPTNTSTGEAKHSASKSIRAPTRLSIGVSKCVQAPARLSAGLLNGARPDDAKRIVSEIVPTERCRLGWVTTTRTFPNRPSANALTGERPIPRRAGQPPRARRHWAPPASSGDHSCVAGTSLVFSSSTEPPSERVTYAAPSVLPKAVYAYAR
jgi:hypothetical protein